MNNTFVVYKHQNLINGKVYIGMSKDTKKRWQPYNYKKCVKFYSAIQKYGWDNFSHEILYNNLTEQEAQNKEIETIELYNSRDRRYGYNIAMGGNKTVTGCKHTEETRKKVSNALKGKYKGRHFSEKSEFKKGHTFSEDTLKKMSLAKIGKPTWNKGLKGYNSGENNAMKRPEVRQKHMGKNNSMSKKVYQYDLQNNFIAVYDCLEEAKRILGFPKSTHISECANGKLKTARGFVWRFKPISEMPTT